MQLGFYFDQSRCIGCDACVTACRSWQQLKPEQPDIINLTTKETGEFPRVNLSHLFLPCVHCAEPRCAYVCPAEAITKNEKGIVVANIEKCRTASRCGIIDEAAMAPGYSYGETDSPCQVTCPAHLHIPGYVALIAKGKFKEALDVIRERMPLPSVCGRVCFAPCESECSRKNVDQSIAIKSLRRFVTEQVGESFPASIPNTKGEKVAIVGSGPAGLSAAYDLIRKGYGVTLFESAPVIGGWLAMGIPQYRLPKEVLKRDIDYVAALGVEMKASAPVTNIDELSKQGYGAILLAMGAQKGQILKIPGADLKGTLIATSFLRDFNLGKKVNVGKKVVVIGGGSVAVDAARTALRLGASSVSMACLECREDMPASVAELAEADEEGIAIYPSQTVSRILGNRGKVTGVECLNLRSVIFDEDGRPHMDIIQGTEHVLPADTVIFAVGQAPDISGSIGDIKLTRRGTIAVDPETMESSQAGVFAAGDVVKGPRNIIEAIADGQRAAFYIDYYLQKSVHKVEFEKAVKASDIRVKIPEDVKKHDRQPVPVLPVAERVKYFSEVAQNFTDEMAVAEAKRCLNCAGHLCKNVCPYDAPRFPDTGTIRIVKCNLCLDRLEIGKTPACVATCPVQALDSGELEQLMAKHGDLRELEDFADYRQTRPSIRFRARSAR